VLTDSELADLVAALDGRPAPAVLDARPAAAFAAGHLRGAASRPGVAEVAADAARLDAVLPSIFLPPRHRSLLVMGVTPVLTAALARGLAARGRARVTGVHVTPADLARLPDRLVERGAVGRPLWEAPAWLTVHAQLLPPPSLGPALDLGCGSGRAAVWLARRGYRVTGIDWQPEALQLAARLASSEGVTLTRLGVDLRDEAVVPPGPWAVVVNVRCLDRPLLARLHRLVAAYGVAVVRTFRDAPGLGPDVRALHRLQAAELARVFATDRWDILAHEEGFDDDGRPAAGIIARRRAER
jgi:SAM-dependent methyltransferase